MLIDLVKQSRSYRRFDESVEISESVLKELIELARLCPSSRNAQPLGYYLISDKRLCQELFPHLRWAGYLKDWDGPISGERPTGYIVVLGDNNISKNPAVDFGITSQTILLGASEKGFGGCMFAAIDRPAIRELLNIPNELEIHLVIALGKPVEEVVITEVKGDGDTKYYRDERGTHYVPKRSLSDVIIGVNRGS